MTHILRTGADPILSKVVEYHGFIFTQGLVARDLSGDVVAQTTDILEQIDHLLEVHRTDKTRLLQAQIWLAAIDDRPAMNKVWAAWLPEGGAPARACVEAKLSDPRIRVEIMITACR